MKALRAAADAVIVLAVFLVVLAAEVVMGNGDE